MHEIAITTALMNAVSKEVQRRGGGQVIEIAMSVGGLQSVDPHSIQSCFTFLAEGTIMDGAVLMVKRLPIVIHCNACSTDGVADNDFHCRECGGVDVRILSSGGMTVDSIVVSQSVS